MDDIIKLHIECKGNQFTDDVGISKDADWNEIFSLIQSITQSSNFEVKYLDDDNELVVLASNLELLEAFRIARKQQNCLYVKVFPTTRSIAVPQKKPESLKTLSKKSVEGFMTAPQEASVAKTGFMGESAKGSEETEAKKPVLPICKVKPKETKTLKKTNSIVKKFFFIRHVPSGLVLDVGNWLSEPGTAVIMFTKKQVGSGQCGNQLWYMDSKNKIRSKFCNLYLTARDDGLCVMPLVAGDELQCWNLLDGRLQPCGTDLTLVPLEHKDYSPVKLQAVPKEGHLWEFRYRHDELVAKKQAAKAQRDPLDLLARSPSLAGCDGCKQSKKGSGGCKIKKQESSDAPKWFATYMDKFKKEMVEQTSAKISQKTVTKVLRGLEGAVITSVEDSGRVTGATSAPASPIGAGSQKNFTSASHGQFCHTGIICDHCDKVIVGSRYKCGNCADFDLCATCEAKPHNHNDDHVFVKIVRPVPYAGRTADGKVVPLLASNLYRRKSEPLSKQMEKLSVVHSESGRTQTKKVEKLRRKAEKLSAKRERACCKEEKLKRRIEQERELPLQKKEKLALPQYYTPDQMDAEFVRHVTIADGTSVLPSLQFVKTWAIKNTGKIPWAPGVTLQMIRGDMAAVKTEYPVPPAEPDEEVSVSVELVAPGEQGVFQSHWQLNYCGILFGKCVWCSVVVGAAIEQGKPSDEQEEGVHDVAQETVAEDDGLRLELEQREQTAAAGEAEKQESTKIQRIEDLSSCSFEKCDKEEPAAGGDVMTRPEDDLSFELLETTRANFAAASPLHEQNSAEEAEIARKKALNAALADALPDECVRALLTSSESDSDDADDVDSEESDADFIVVPIPDCFNPTLPNARTASTSVYVSKDTPVCHSDAHDDECVPLLRSSQTEDERAISCQAPDAVVSASSPQDEEEAAVNVSNVLCEMRDERTSTTHQDAQSEENNEQVRDNDSDIDDDVAFRDCAAAPPEDVARVAVENQESKQAAEHDDACGDTEDVTAVKTRSLADQDKEEDTAEGNVASGKCEEARPTFDVFDPFNDCDPRKSKPDVVAQAIGIATNAGTKVYHMAKDVFHTLQAKNNYEPPQSAWNPPPSQWTPPENDWKPSAVQWVPGEARVIGREPTPTALDEQLLTEGDAMQRLIEMGFANRSLNQRLLDEHNCDLVVVVRELLAQDDRNWHVTRH